MKTLPTDTLSLSNLIRQDPAMERPVMEWMDKLTIRYLRPGLFGKVTDDELMAMDANEMRRAAESELRTSPKD